MTAPAPSFNDLYDLGVAEATGRNSALTFDPGDVSDQMVGASAAMADHVVGWASGRFAALYLDGSSGDDLTVFADDRYNVQRYPASSAVGVVSYTRAGNGPAGTIFAGSVVATGYDSNGNQVQFVVQADVNWALNETGTKSVNIVASLAGPTGNVAAGTITNAVTALFDASITLSNGAATAGGNDAESDEALRARVRALPASQQKGTLDALEYGAKTVAGVSVASARLDDTTGIVSLYVADAQGNSNPTIVANVQAIMPSWQCAGEIVNVYGGNVYTQNVVLSLTVKTGVDPAALVSKVQSAVTARMAKLGSGETLTRTMIRSAATSVDADNITEVTVATPATDVAPSPGQIIRAGTVTVS